MEMGEGMNESRVFRFSFFVTKRKTNNACRPKLQQERRLEQRTTSRPHIAVILSDSCCTPRRQGVTAFALAVSGLDPIRSEIGSVDLFGKKLRMTHEAVADQLSTAANFLMGNAGQSVPGVIVRGHGLKLSNFEGWVPGIKAEEDLFQGM